MSIPATESLIHEFNNLFRANKFLDTLQLASPSATWWTSGIKEQNPGAGMASFEGHIQGMLAVPKEVINWENLEVNVVDLIVDQKGEKAVLELFTRLKDDDGVYRYTNDIVLIFEVREGKIQSIREYMDFAAVVKYITEKKEREGVHGSG